MSLRSIAAFEWRYQLRSPVFWVGCLMFFLLAFLATASDNVQIGSLGNVHRNSPYALLTVLTQLGVFSIFVTAAIVAGVVLRDDETNFAPIIRATPVGKAAYLGGRFAGACAAALAVLAALPLGVLAGSVMPWQDVEKIGPFLPGDYLYALFAFELPTLLVTAAMFFALATATRSLAWTYVCAVGMLVLYRVGLSMAASDPAWERVAALLDPFGILTLRHATRYWTASERNTLLPAYEGVLLANRALWSAVALGVAGLAWRAFSFAPRPRGAATRAAQPDAPPESTGRFSRARRAARAHRDELAALGQANPAVLRELQAAQARRAPPVLPDVPPPGAASARAQLWALARMDMAFVLRSPAFAVLLVIGLLLAAGAVWFSGDILGSPSYPVTRLMVQGLRGGFSIMPVIIAVYYGGELVWRDRERRVHEIVDATAAPDWTHLAPKVVAIVLVLLSSVLVAVLAAIVFQACNGWFRFEIADYLLWFVWPMTVAAVQVAVLSVFVQVLLPQKFLGWAAMLVYFVASIGLNDLGFEHNLYNYAGAPDVPLSDMDGQGRFWIAQAWFQLYWSAFAAMLLVAAHALWRRGADAGLRARLRRARAHLRGGARAILAVAALVWAGSGAWIFYNTNVLNRYETRPEHDRRMADLEKTLLPLENVPQPRVAGVTLDVALFPRAARAVTHGRYVLVNRTDKPISELHLQWADNLRLDAIDFPGATVKTDWPRFHYRIWQLATPMQPGEQRTLGFTTTLEQRGFPNRDPLTAIVPDGSFVNNAQITPSVGFTRTGLLDERAKRRKYGLPAELRPARLEDEAARRFNAFTHDSDWVRSDITVSTDGDQTPVAPGRVVADTGLVADRDARRSVHFVSEAPINQFFSIQSGRYQVRHATWHAPAGEPPRDVDLAVYFAPGHEMNVDRMLDAMSQSLTLYEQRFGPYQFGQARIVEFPAYANFAQSFANTIPFSEGIGFVQHFADSTKIDVATYVTAHEMAHQWWGHQLVPADQQGAAMLEESFAQYCALLVMEKMYGRDQVRRFLKYELDRYLRSRGGAVLEELPLDRVENQDYIYYRKGSLVMYWAREALGEAAVDTALRQMLAQYAFKGAPYPNTTDFLRLLRAQARPQDQALITDLFDRITLLDLKASDATAHRLPDGRYEVKVHVSARKFYADGAGRETEVPMDEQVELGVFDAEPGGKGFGAGDVLLLQKVRVQRDARAVDERPAPSAPAGARWRWMSPLAGTGSGAPTSAPPAPDANGVLAVVVDRAPAWIGIDPYNKRIDRNSEDNLTRVDIR